MGDTVKLANQPVCTHTKTGELLSELGKGLPENGTTCTGCYGVGYHKQNKSLVWTMCGDCNGHHRLDAVPCRRCSGSGKFEKQGKYVGVCFNCKGTGLYKPKHPVTCHNCNPAKPEGAFGKVLGRLRKEDPRLADYIMQDWLSTYRGYIPEVHAEYTLCHACKGIGEVFKVFDAYETIYPTPRAK